MSSRPVVREDEWVCVNSRCQNVNAAIRRTCHYCGQSRPRSKGQVGHEIGKEAAEKSKGLFSAEDWACSKCGNINWARRSQCNICNAAKVGEVEVRTGYGGGYMDRQEVERRRSGSDDEYDHFGRLKKKGSRSRAQNQDSNESRGNEEGGDQEKVAVEAEEEEEEDDDGSDLEKYNFDLEFEDSKRVNASSGKRAKEDSGRASEEGGARQKNRRKRSDSRSASSSRSRSSRSGSNVSDSRSACASSGSSGSSGSSYSSEGSRSRSSRSGSYTSGSSSESRSSGSSRRRRDRAHPSKRRRRS